MIKTIAQKFMEKGEHVLARRLQKCVAFDTRFNLMQDNHKCIYMLDVPLFDKHYELHSNDGNKKLLSDEEVTNLLKKERDFNDNIKNKASDQLKKVTKFAKMGEIGLDPEQKMQQEMVEQVQKEAPGAPPFNGDKEKE